MVGSQREQVSPLKGDAAKTIGLIVNPVAGMGGAVGLKGTDGRAVLERAITLGAKPVAPVKARRFLSGLKPAQRHVRLVAGAGKMGEREAARCGFQCTSLGIRKKETGPEDTKEVARAMASRGVDLLVFCGGDGTARDLLDVIGTSLPVLGVPTGVKMHSAVFAVDPRAAARLAIGFVHSRFPLKEAEVMDVDEEAFRKGRLSAALYGYMLAPYAASLVQGVKAATPMTESELRNQAALAVFVIENLKPGTIYILGPGTTTRTIADLLDLEKTLLGVDLLCDREMIGRDVNEKQILAEIRGRPAQIIVTPIGGQGFIFGRGNQQISPKVIRLVGPENVMVIATDSKIRALSSLKVDTGDPDLDEAFRSRRVKVVTDYGKEIMMAVS